MKRGEVDWVHFDPSTGTEIQKTRPGVIVSNDQFNSFGIRFQIIPLTSKVDRIYPSEAWVFLKGEKRKAMADQIITADHTRLGKKLGDLSVQDLKLVDRALKAQLYRRAQFSGHILAVICRRLR